MDLVNALRDQIIQNTDLNQELSLSRRQKASSLQTVSQQAGHIEFDEKEMNALTHGMEWRTGVDSATPDRFHEILQFIKNALGELAAANRNIRTEIDANYDVMTALERQAHENRGWVIPEERFKEMNPQDRWRVAQGARVLPSAGIGSPGGGDGDDAFDVIRVVSNQWTG